MELKIHLKGTHQLHSRDAILIARNDPGIQQLLQQDVRADVFVRILTQTEIDIMDQEYPDLFPQKTAPIFAINAISSTNVFWSWI